MKHKRPTAAQILALRKKVQAHYGLGIIATQEKLADAAQAADYRTWRQWEKGIREMHPGLWTLLQLRTNSHPHWRLVKKPEP